MWSVDRIVQLRHEALESEVARVRKKADYVGVCIVGIVGFCVYIVGAVVVACVFDFHDYHGSSSSSTSPAMLLSSGSSGSVSNFGSASPTMLLPQDSHWVGGACAGVLVMALIHSIFAVNCGAKRTLRRQRARRQGMEQPWLGIAPRIGLELVAALEGRDYEEAKREAAEARTRIRAEIRRREADRPPHWKPC